MPIGYRDKMTDIYNLLQGANSIGAAYDLSSNMTKRVQTILKGNPDNIPNQVNLYPCIYIHLDNKTEDFDAIGKVSTIRKAEINWNIVGLVYKAPGSDDSDKEVHYLSENIEQIFRNNLKFTSDMIFNIVGSTEFDSMYADGIYLSASLLNLKTTHLY